MKDPSKILIFTWNFSIVFYFSLVSDSYRQLTEVPLELALSLFSFFWEPQPVTVKNEKISHKIKLFNNFLCFFHFWYVAARLYKTFGGEKWKTQVLLTAFMVSGFIFGIFFLMNMILWNRGSSAAIPFTTLIAIVCLWLGISTPLVFVGAYMGYKKNPIEHPVRTNPIPRQVPEQIFYTKPVPGILMGGVLPFGCIFIQLFFILNSIWAHQTYYMFGFLFLVTIILVITCSETTILLCYFHLAAEDYNWWWRSFLTSGMTGIYFFLYGVHFFNSKLDITETTSAILYFGYMLIMTSGVVLFTGTIGFFACFWFVTKIYSAVKVD